MAIATSVQLPTNKRLQFRLDAYNVFNSYIINGRNTTINFVSPTNLSVLNSETLTDGSIDPNRTLPKNAGFGAATSAINHGTEAGLGSNYNRVLQVSVRFQF